MNRTRAEMAFAELLDRHRIQYEVEKIFLSGDRYILVDFFLKDQMLAIEVDDGSAHDSQKKYDAGRDRWLFDAYGVKTLRIATNDAICAPQSLLERIINRPEALRFSRCARPSR